MKVGILGTGDVGKALGNGFLALGHSVMLAGREPNNAKAEEWLKKAASPGAKTGSFKDAAKFGDIVVLATLGTATLEAMKMAGPENLNGKIVLDTTNPLDFSSGKPKLVGGLGDSAGEKHQKLAPQAHVVKVFNTVGNALMFKPKLQGGPPTMFICGNDAGAKQKVTELCRDFGWETLDAGGIESSHYLEAMCLVWVLTAIKTGGWMQAFKMLRA